MSMKGFVMFLRKLLLVVLCGVAAVLLFPLTGADASPEGAPPVAYHREARCLPGPPRVEVRYDQVEFIWDKVAAGWVVAPRQDVAWSDWQVKRYIYRETVKKGACGDHRRAYLG